VHEHLNAGADLIQSFDPPTFYLIEDVELYAVPEA
jgi:hypothetical protein